MALVDYVDLVSSLGGRELDLVPEIPGVVDTAVGRRIDLDKVDSSALVDGHTGGAAIARLPILRVVAVDCLGQDPGRAGLTGAPRATKQVRVHDPPCGDCVAEGAGNVILSHHL